MELKIALIRGDGIGGEIIECAVAVLDAVLSRGSHTAHYAPLHAGGAAYDIFGTPLPPSTLAEAEKCGAILLGALGAPQWDGVKKELRPERALLGLRKHFDLYTNLRPARLFTALRERSPLRDCKGFDILIVRELVGGIYFGENGTGYDKNGRYAYDTERYGAAEVRRIGERAFLYARKRARRLTSVDKANVLASSRLWREVMHELAAKNPDVAYEDMYVDNAAMQLIKCPERFDVIVTTNMFGDILSDELAQLTGSIGLLPSASLGAGSFGMYEPAHGSAPDIAGKGIANPIAAILSGALMLRYSFGLEEEARLIEQAVENVLKGRICTPDLGGSATSEEVTKEIIAMLGE